VTTGLGERGAKAIRAAEPSLPVRSLNWPGVELRHLLALCAVAEERSFVRAAARLGYTQSAVSQQVAALERALGRRLLERTQGRGPIELTDAGRAVMRCAEAVARELSLTKATLDRIDGGERVLHVGVHASTGLPLVPDALAALGRDLSVRLVESPDERHLLELMAHDQLDVAFVSAPVPSDFSGVELFAEEFVGVVGDPDAGLPEPLTPQLLAPCVLLALRNQRMLVQLERYFEASGVCFDVAMTVDHPETACEFAARGQGIALLPRSLARPGVDRVLELENAPIRRLALVWRTDSDLGEPVARFVAAVQRVRGVRRLVA
jgi:DNA-binding transcriptional LysR family regulator